MPSSSGTSRGGFAPRRGRGGVTRPFAKPRVPVKLDTKMHPLGQLLQTYHASDLTAGPKDLLLQASITGCEYVASYNWLCEETPTVIIPGKPPQWTPPQVPQRLKEDDGQYFRDPNAAKYPAHPIAPVVHAVLDANPDFRTEDIDLFACGSTLGNLLRFVRGENKAFRFNVEIIGETVFLIRKENDPKELIQDVRGFGHTFPEAYTTWEKDVKGSETHQRIVQYEFGHLKCVVRFESDGYIKETSTSSRTSPSKSSSKAKEDDLLQAFQNSAISQPIHATSSSNEAIVIKRGGSKVPQHSIFDLKTRSGRYNREIDMNDIYPLLWIKQIPNFIIAYHDGRGMFHDIRVQDVKKDVQIWARNNANAIHRLSTLLHKIIEITKNDEKGLLEVHFSGEGGLEIWSQHGEGVHALPAELMKKWAGNATVLESTGCGASENDGKDEKHGAGHDSDRGWKADWDDEDPDYTACTAEDCGYCGKCTY
ncbi:hypothetical protein BKA66DRAFT_410580 [Pyrenochaeta sp. MPI-SDFR-AT-0127]|nr:hypothetical protein BKA66DRAFT_410580 [Pyrenochaeta sp. MPI-SDFR-AT-0127]